MPKLTGTQALRRLREQPPCNHLKIIMMSGGVSTDEMAEMLALGADDYLAKPLGRQQLIARAKAALVHKATQDRSETLNQQLLSINAELEKTLAARTATSCSAQRSGFRPGQDRRIALAGNHRPSDAHVAVCRRPGAARWTIPRLAPVLDEAFLKTLESCTPLHDIGNVALPDHVLRGNARL